MWKSCTYVGVTQSSLVWPIQLQYPTTYCMAVQLFQQAALSTVVECALSMNGNVDLVYRCV